MELRDLQREDTGDRLDGGVDGAEVDRVREADPSRIEEVAEGGAGGGDDGVRDVALVDVQVDADDDRDPHDVADQQGVVRVAAGRQRGVEGGEGVR